jgi:uncharacterized protein (TIGR02271 family)
MADYGTAVGYFSSQNDAEIAINDLIQAGFKHNEIGLAARHPQEGVVLPSTTGQTRASTAYEAGQSAGGAWQAVKSFFGGNTAEPYAGETSKETFNDRVVTPDGYGSEDVHHSLAGLSVPADRAKYFGHRLGTADEGVVVTVNAPGREEEAIAILERDGADIGDEADSYDYEATGTKPADAQNIQLYGEVLRVQKDRVNRGEVRIRKEVLTTTQTIEVPVTREELVVERVPVSGQVAASNATFEAEEIRIPLSEERAYVKKQAVVREEVSIGKREVTNVESFDEQVRREELKVDPGATNVVDKSA